MHFKKNIVLVGPTRTGTTTIFRSLAQHPLIAPSCIKELNFFFEWGPINRSEAGNYWKYFPSDKRQVSVEASPLYFSQSARVAGRIKQELKNPRIIIGLREPSDRWISFLRHLMNKKEIGNSQSGREIFEKSKLFLCEDANSTEELLYAGLCEGYFSDLIPIWVKEFGTDHVFLYDYNLLAHPDSQLWLFRRLFDWLEIDDCGFQLAYRHDNKTRKPKFRRLNMIANDLNHRLEPVLSKMPRTHSFIRDAYYYFNEDRRGFVIEIDFESEVRQYFKRETEFVLKLLDDKRFGTASEYHDLAC